MNKIKELLQIEVEKAGRGVKKRCVNVYVGGWGRCGRTVQRARSKNTIALCFT